MGIVASLMFLIFIEPKKLRGLFIRTTVFSDTWATPARHNKLR